MVSAFRELNFQDNYPHSCPFCRSISDKSQEYMEAEELVSIIKKEGEIPDTLTNRLKIVKLSKTFDLDINVIKDIINYAAQYKIAVVKVHHCFILCRNEVTKSKTALQLFLAEQASKPVFIAKLEAFSKDAKLKQ